MKKFRKQTIVRIEKYWEWHFQKLPNLRINTKHTQVTSNEKIPKTNYNKNWNILIMTYLNNWKLKKYPKTKTKTKKLIKLKKPCKEASYDKSLEKKLLLELRNIKNDIFKNFKNLIINKKHEK